MRRRAAFGQERGEVVFEALHTLDGREVDLATAAAGDALGMGGFRARPTCTPAPRRCASPSPPPSITLDPLKASVTLTVIIKHPITL